MAESTTSESAVPTWDAELMEPAARLLSPHSVCTAASTVGKAMDITDAPPRAMQSATSQPVSPPRPPVTASRSGEVVEADVEVHAVRRPGLEGELRRAHEHLCAGILQPAHQGAEVGGDHGQRDHSLHPPRLRGGDHAQGAPARPAEP